jgi:hypothetical protein
LWGRFSLRNTLSRTEIIHDPVKFLEIVDNHRFNVLRVDTPAPQMAMVTYEPRNCFVEENPVTNVVISLFTTSAARLRLLVSMERVYSYTGAELLYTDTYVFALNIQLKICMCTKISGKILINEFICLEILLSTRIGRPLETPFLVDLILEI